MYGRRRYTTYAPRRRALAHAPARRAPVRRRAVKPKQASAQRQIGKSIGSQIGSFLGHGAQSLIKAITGFGDYRVEHNSLMLGGMSPPEVKNAIQKGGIIMRHREYITDIAATTNFTLQEFAINPGLVSTFPWLSGVAQNFEEYTLRGMIFEFKSMSSDAVLSTAANSALGTVIMATQYNASNPVFVDKKSMENYEFANSSKPSESFIHPIECKKSVTPVSELYIRTGAPTTGTDIRLYDIGNFQIATQGMQVAGGIIGELWCSFEIELYKPKLVTELGEELLTDHWDISVGATNAAPLGSAPVLKDFSTIGTTITGAGTVINFPSYVSGGSFLITYAVFGTGAAVTSPVFTPTNGTLLSIWRKDTLPTFGIQTGTTTNIYMIEMVMDITATGALITITPGVLPTTITAGDLFITQVNGNIQS